MSTKGQVELPADLFAVTERAYGVFNLNDEKVWIPRSQVTDHSGDEENPETIFIPIWLAEEKELV